MALPKSAMLGHRPERQTQVNSSSQHDVGAKRSGLAGLGFRVPGSESGEPGGFIEHGRGMLVQKVEPDPYLSEVAGRSRSALASRKRRADGIPAAGWFSLGSDSKLYSPTRSRSEHPRLGLWAGAHHVFAEKKGFSVTACDRDGGADENSAFRSERPILTEQNIDVVPLTDDVKLPFQTGSFDCVTSFGVLEHVARDLDSLKEIRRVLRPRGASLHHFPAVSAFVDTGGCEALR